MNYEIKNVTEVVTSSQNILHSTTSLKNNLESINFILNEVGNAWQDSSNAASSVKKELEANVQQLENICSAATNFASGMSEFGAQLIRVSSNEI